MKRHEQLGFNFFRYCNENLSNTNEYNIARIIIEHIGDIKTVSLEQIAQEANISIASVSRLLKLSAIFVRQNLIWTWKNLLL